MVAVILPTREVIKEVMKHDHLFAFYGGGIKEFLVYHFQCSASWNGERERKDIADELFHKAYIDYDHYYSQREGNYKRESVAMGIMNQILPVNEYLSRQATAIMSNIFVGMAYEVSQMWWQWNGDDLVIGVDAWYV